MNQKHQQNIYYVSADVSSVIANVILVKISIMIHVGASVKIQKNIMCMKKIIFGILVHVLMKMVNI